MPVFKYFNETRQEVLLAPIRVRHLTPAERAEVLAAGTMTAAELEADDELWEPPEGPPEAVAAFYRLMDRLGGEEQDDA